MTQIKEPIHTEKDLDRLRRNNKFNRDEKFKDTVHSIQLGIMKGSPYFTGMLFILAITEPSYIKNLELVIRVMWGFGGVILGSILTRVNAHQN